MEEENEELGVGQDWPLPRGSVEHKGAGTRLSKTVGAFLNDQVLEKSSPSWQSICVDVYAAALLYGKGMLSLLLA